MKKLLIILTCGLLFATNLNAQSGTTGDLSWSIANDTLRIRVTAPTGTVTMNNFNFDFNNWVTAAPWGTHRDSFSVAIIEERVISIGNRAFMNLTGLTSVTIPSSVTMIGNQAFNNCTGLTYIVNEATTPQNLGFGVFDRVVLANATLRVPPGAGFSFSGAEGWVLFSCIIEEVEGDCIAPAMEGISGDLTWSIANDTLRIRVTAPTGTEAMNNFDFDMGVTAPWDARRDSFSVAIIEERVTSIGNNAFFGGTGLTSVTIPNSVTSIGSQAFWSTGLTYVVNDATTPQNLDFGVFSDVPLANATLRVPVGAGRSFADARGWTLFGCIIEEVEGDCIAPAMEGISGNLSWSIANDTLRIRVTAPTGTATMNNFGSISVGDGIGLTSAPWGRSRDFFSVAIIEERVTTVGGMAFLGCTGLTSIVIGNSLTSIGSEAFQRTTNLTSVTMLNSTPPTLGTNVFQNSNPERCLYVPPRAKEAYTNWGGFTCIRELVFRITFDPNGGTVNPTLGTTGEGGRLAFLPTPTRNEYTFTGWFTDTVGGTQITTNTVFNADDTIFAQWSEASNIVETHGRASLHVHPNPVTNELHITYDWQSGDVVELFDMNGRRVFSQRVAVETQCIASLQSGTFTIDMSPFPNGNYILRIGNRIAKIVKR